MRKDHWVGAPAKASVGRKTRQRIVREIRERTLKSDDMAVTVGFVRICDTFVFEARIMAEVDQQAKRIAGGFDI